MDDIDTRLMQYLSNGYTLTECSRLIDRSYVSTAQRLHRLKHKYGAENIAHLIAIAMRAGVIK